MKNPSSKILFLLTAFGGAESLNSYCVTALSALSHNPGCEFRILHDNSVPKAAVTGFVEWLDRRGVDADAKLFDLPLRSDLEPHNGMLLKLFHLTAWPDDAGRKCVLLDYDVLVRHPLHEVFDTLTDSIALYPQKDGTFNAGVAAFVMPQADASRFTLLMQLLADYRYTPKAGAEFDELLWEKFFGTVQIATRRWNWCAHELRILDQIKAHTAVDDPYTVHFTGAKKPWTGQVTLGAQKYADEWCRFADKFDSSVPIELCYSVNGTEYTRYALISALGALRHTLHDVKVTLFTTDTAATLDVLEECPRLTSKLSVQVFEIPAKWTGNGKCRHYSPAVFGKNLAPYIFDECAPVKNGGEDTRRPNRFLTLDPDIHIRADLALLMRTRIDDGHPFAACHIANWALEPKYRTERGLLNINGGVVLWDAATAREKCPLETCLEKMRELRDADFSQYPDEDLFLWCYGNEFTVLPMTWNHWLGQFGAHPIVHFIHTLKPWAEANSAAESKYGEFSAFFAEWRANKFSFECDIPPDFVRHTAIPPMLPIVLSAQRGKTCYCANAIWDGTQYHPRGAAIGKSGEPLCDLLTAYKQVYTVPEEPISAPKGAE